MIQPSLFSTQFIITDVCIYWIAFASYFLSKNKVIWHSFYFLHLVMSALKSNLTLHIVWRTSPDVSFTLWVRKVKPNITAGCGQMWSQAWETTWPCDVTLLCSTMVFQWITGCGKSQLFDWVQVKQYLPWLEVEAEVPECWWPQDAPTNSYSNKLNFSLIVVIMISNSQFGCVLMVNCKWLLH